MYMLCMYGSVGTQQRNRMRVISKRVLFAKMPSWQTEADRVHGMQVNTYKV